jgi:hypothetical protein
MNFEIIDNNLLKVLFFIKCMRRHFKFIIIFIGLTHQTIDLTINYLKYKTVISIRSESRVENWLSISFCLTSNYQLKVINEMKRKNETIGDFIYRSTKFDSIHSFGPKPAIVGSLTLFAFRCFTFLSELTEKRNFSVNDIFKKISNGSQIELQIFNSLNLMFIIHSSKISPHLFTQMVWYEYQSWNVYNIFSIKEYLLRFS